MGAMEQKGERSMIDYDVCYECSGYGDDYYVDDDGNLVSNCTNCPNNPIYDDDEEYE